MRKYKNFVTMSMTVSKNGQNQSGQPIYSLRKVSDKLSVCDCFQGMGQGNDAMNWTVNITSKTKIADGLQLAPLTAIDVSGRFEKKTYTNNQGVKKAQYIIWASEITATEEVEDAPSGINPAFANGMPNMADDTSSPNVAANIEDILPLSTDDGGFVNIADVDADLPFN